MADLEWTLTAEGIESFGEDGWEDGLDMALDAIRMLIVNGVPLGDVLGAAALSAHQDPDSLIYVGGSTVQTCDPDIVLTALRQPPRYRV